MNRATFFKTLGIGLLTAPAVVKVLAEEPRGLFPQEPYGGNWKLNPAWESARYEVHFWCSTESHKRFEDHFRGITFSPGCIPFRFNECDGNGNPVLIEPYCRS